jgi:putative nucleotidyltransferase with HDIG domain
MNDRMDKALLAFQAAATARKIYGADHPVATRQLNLATDTFTAILAEQQPVRLVRLDRAVLCEDAVLSCSSLLADTLVARFALHGIEWVEFRAGVSRNELITFGEQLDQPAGDAVRLGTSHIRLGRLGRIEGGGRSGAGAGSMAFGDYATQLRQIWANLRGGDRPDERLTDLVESIRLAVAVGADVCQQLADVKSHDEYTFVHTVNVAILSAALGEAVGMAPNQVFDLTLAALLHDVGKQRTPLTILNKPGKLDDTERKQMERHTVTGAAILLQRPGVPDVAPIVAFEHHANLDGSGYPRLVRNGRPHLASQIVHVADVFDALRTNRPYRAALDDAKVRQILMEGAGKSFDPALVELFLEQVVTGKTPGVRRRSA